MLDLGDLGFAQHLDRHVGQIAHDGFDVAADVTDFGELGRFNLDEGGACESCEASSNFGFAHPGGADHENVFRRNLVTHFFVELHSAPAIAERDGDGAFSVVLADDVFVQLVDDFARRHQCHDSFSVSMVRWWLV